MFAPKNLPKGNGGSAIRVSCCCDHRPLALFTILAGRSRQGRSSVGSSTLTAAHAASPASLRARGRSSLSPITSLHLSPTMSKRDIFDDLDDDVDKEILTGMNLTALEYDLKLCREHGTYVPTETLAFAIHHVLQDDTAELIKHLSAYMKKGE
jgi:hypothetical protein